MEKPSLAEIEAARPYIEIANQVLEKFSDYTPIRYDNNGSVRAALKLIEITKGCGDNGLAWFRLAVNEYSVEKMGGAPPKSLGHPYFRMRVRSLASDFRKLHNGIQREMMFVERSA